MRKSGSFYPLLLLVCWTGLVGAGSYALVETTVRQYLAVNYSSTEARIWRSEVGHGAVSRRGVEMDYTYAVNGVRYRGHRYRYDDHNVALEWDTTVDDFPTGSSRTVFYNPRNPADSLLEPGVDGCDTLLLLFALPLDVLTCTLWSAMIVRWRERSDVPPAGGVKILKQPGGVCVSLEKMSAVATGFYGMAAAAFFAAFPVVIVAGFDPSMRSMKFVWVIVLASGVVAFVWRTIRNRSGIYDLRIDQASQTVVLPQTAGRQERMAVARGEISAVSLQRRVSKSPSGLHFSYLPVLKRNGLNTGSHSVQLITWGWSQERAQAFSQWLSQELGVEFKGVEEEQPETAAVH